MVSLRVVFPGSPAGHTAQRRASIALACLRNEKLAAGDWIRISCAGKAVIAQVWPSLAINEDEVVLSRIHCLALGDPVQVDLERLEGKDVKWMTAKAVTISVQPMEGRETSPDEKGKERKTAWELALLKEILQDLRYISTGYKLTLPSATSPNPSDSLTTYTITGVTPSKQVGFTSPATSQKTVKADKATQNEIEERLARLSFEGSQDQEVYAMHVKTEVSFANPDEVGANGDDGKKSGSRSKATVNRSRGDTANPALPSYINIYPPGPFNSTSESFSAYETLGGLSKQIAQVRALLDLPLSQPELYQKFGLKPPRGIMLYGPPGTGKTHLARAISSSTEGCSCIVVNGPELSSAYHGETEERIRAVFDEAKKREPCIVVLDEVDAICPKREGGEGGEVERRVVATLLTLMDGMSEGIATVGGNEKAVADLARVVVIAATNRPNAVDPALRRPGRFDREIEIGIPDAIARREILGILISKMPHDIAKSDLDKISDRTHGYVGADLSSLVREAGSIAIHRWISAGPEKMASPVMTTHDLESALLTIRPSAMREVFVETPKVRWSDIGGQADVKQKLRECVEWPLTHPETFTRLGVMPPRGVLLYGPPGCSKTLTAKALATESGINFMAVKGPELLNKFVGESERAVREIFRKARAASPSIIFFDEIDALATARGSDHDGPVQGVLTSLLNEMDGIEEMSGVITVAATNRPDVLDSALLRPGRLDRILYVGPPNFEARKDIFRIRFSKMAIEDGTAIEDLAFLTEGCSGAEIASICQDAALTTMNENLNAPFVRKQHLLDAAKSVRRRITPNMISQFEAWRDQSGARSV
ncbi:hypothetical protein NliqN6_1772 [Naganishia liquefaciens]|uniref:AAA+ ATPase domain-containing protein n=1 Tax=Naganishia liquefaciens TaxID=104408 RepID=A0A8H3TQI9_9TREE|nr:hypothetical protein NliqN6_1772 [Naganishia liquefaciens]